MAIDRHTSQDEVKTMDCEEYEEWKSWNFDPQRSDCAIHGTEQPAAVPCTCFEIEWTILF